MPLSPLSVYLACYRTAFIKAQFFSNLITLCSHCKLCFIDLSLGHVNSITNRLQYKHYRLYSVTFWMKIKGTENILVASVLQRQWLPYDKQQKIVTTVHEIWQVMWSQHAYLKQWYSVITHKTTASYSTVMKLPTKLATKWMFTHWKFVAWYVDIDSTALI